MQSVSQKAALVARLRGARPGQEQLFGPGVEEQIAGWETDGIRLLTALDPEYPGNLEAVRDRPGLIFLAGELKPSDARALAVIGSRKASDEGLSAAQSITEHLVERGFTILSGLAAGVDTAAHTAALNRAGRTIAVIGTGLRRVYPPQNAELQQRIARECAVVSQFLPDDPPSPRSFPMRNAVMSGMALGTVIVEATHTSGARVQARFALAQSRPVFLREALLGQAWARELVTRPGVHVFDDPEQVIATVTA